MPLGEFNSMHSSFSGIRRVVIHPAAWCAIAVAFCVFASRPVLEMGFGDDFSYIWTARALAETGHVVYNGWATAMLGWQIYLGALFIKLFGFSFTAVRVSVLLVGMATAALLQRLSVRMGLNEWNATLATLTLTLSPLFLPLTFSFMTDVPGFLSILICLYSCIRAVQANSDRAAIRWLIFAAVSNAIGGTVRQIAWLGALVMVPSTVWVLRRRRGTLAAGAILWTVSAVFVAVCMYWFKSQPYSVNEKLILGNHLLSRKYFTVLLFSLPILIAFVARYPIKERWARIQGGAAVLAILLVGGACVALWHTKIYLAAPYVVAPFSEEMVSVQGLDIGGLPGHRPAVLSMPFRITLTLVTFAAFLAFLLCLINASRLEEHRDADNAGQISNQTILIILGPFTAAYLFLLITRASFFERYFLPLLFIFLVFLTRFYQTKIASRLPVVSIVFVILFGGYGIATLHDLMAADRASLGAADELRAAGVPRSEIKAGVEYDGWTEIELTGYVNDPHLRIPEGAYHAPPPQSLPSQCVFWFDSYTPAIQGRYELTYSPLPCFPESEFPPFEYTTWLAPHHQQIHILKLPK
jgi:hypothetical protein